MMLIEAIWMPLAGAVIVLVTTLLMGVSPSEPAINVDGRTASGFSLPLFC